MLSPDQLMLIARQHLDAGRAMLAQDLCRGVLSEQPARADALWMLGLIAGGAGQLEQAILLLRRATASDPQFAQVFVDLGNCLRDAEKNDEASEAYSNSLSLDPSLYVAHAGLGDIFRKQGNMPQAIVAYQAAIAIEPSIAEIHNNLGIALAAKGDLKRAVASFSRATALNPKLTNAHFNAANAHAALDDLDAAIAAYQQAIHASPDFAEAYSNLGNSLEAKGELDLAIAAYEKAIMLNPDRPEPHWNRSLALLKQGDFQRGWIEYEWRHHRTNAPECFAMAWNGQDLSGKTILLRAEQGLGDTIQFVRYLPMVAALGAGIILECPAELCQLLAGLAGVLAVIPSGQPLPRVDFQQYLMSLPRIFGTRLETIPREVPYLKADPLLVKKWKSILGPANGRRRFGLVWAGRPQHPFDRHRSIGLAELAGLKTVGNIEWYSLQKGPAARQLLEAGLGMDLIDHTELLTDFSDTAAMVSLLDGVVAVDTSVAHLAAALGRPVWLLLAFLSDWRWLLGRGDSPWYPTVQLFRQQRMGDWGPVVDEVCNQLIAGHHHSVNKAGPVD